jgi:hypothetical protein
MITQIAKPHPTRRTSSDSAWPARRADGTKLYERPLAERTYRAEKNKETEND